MAYKVLAPLRVSTDRQDIESQKQELKDYIIREKFAKEDEIYFLEAVGASAFKQDEDYIKFIEDIKRVIINTPSINTVCVWHINRLGRNETPLINIKNFLIENKIQLIIKEPELKLLNNDGSINAGIELCFSLFATMSKQQIQELKAKTKRAKKYLLEKGRYIGGKIKFGYTLDDNKYFILNETNSKTVELIFDLYANKDFSTYSLVEELKLRGYNDLGGYLLNQDFINSILKDESYIGRRFLPRIITDEIWEKVQNKLKTNNSNKDKTKSILLGAKLIKCPICGSSMIRTSRRYSCWKKDTTCKRGNISIDINQLDKVLIFESKFYHISYLNRLSSIEKDKINDEIDVLNQKIDNVQALVSGLSQKKIKIQEGYEEGIYNKIQRDEKLAKLGAIEKDYSKNIIEFKEEIKRKNDLIVSASKLNKVDKYLGILGNVLNEEDKKELYDIIHLHIKRVELNRISTYCFEVKLVMSDNKEIVYNYFPKSKTCKWFKKEGDELKSMFDGEKDDDIGRIEDYK